MNNEEMGSVSSLTLYLKNILIDKKKIDIKINIEKCFSVQMRNGDFQCGYEEFPLANGDNRE